MAASQRDSFLPDFCHIRSVFAVVITAELLTFVLVIAQAGRIDFWQTLGILSLFVQWIALASAAALCLGRPLLMAAFGDRGAGVAAYVLVLAVAALVSALGHWLLGEPAATRPAFVLRVVAIAAIVAAVLLRYLYVQYQARRRLHRESQARVEALQARIRPHFLFNSLNTIASMISTAPDRAEAAVEDLADLFRASLGQGRPLVTLGEELELAHRYLRMESLRLGERLRVEWRVDALPIDALIPPLSLQPLLENAVYYGVEPRPEGGVIAVRGETTAERLRLIIDNPCPERPSGRRGSGIGQDNVRERLRLAFGPEAGLDAVERASGYRLQLTLPYRRQSDAGADRRR